MKKKCHQKKPDKTSGTLCLYIHDFIKYLLQQGYSNKYMLRRIAIIKQFDDWIIHKNITVTTLNKEQIYKFVAYRRSHFGLKLNGNYIAVLQCFLTFLEEQGYVQKNSKVENSDKNTACILGFAEYLAKELGLTANTIVAYSRDVRQFLKWRFINNIPYLNKIRPKDITGFLVSYAQKEKSKRTLSMATSLRSFFTFLYRKGISNINLAPIVPSSATWNQASIPEHLSESDMEKLLNSCDRKKKSGLRDFAILMLLSRLGIRASEVLKLTLDDIDWVHGEITIRGKGSKISQFPLAEDVGTAVATYLKEGRPICKSRSLFLRVQPPHRELQRATSISGIVRSALNRAGICTRKKGAHLLRHTFATNLLQHGSSLQEVGQVLQHCSINTTAIYAKVDFQQLYLVAIPWPLDLANEEVL